MHTAGVAYDERADGHTGYRWPGLLGTTAATSSRPMPSTTTRRSAGSSFRWCVHSKSQPRLHSIAVHACPRAHGHCHSIGAEQPSLIGCAGPVWGGRGRGRARSPATGPCRGVADSGGPDLERAHPDGAGRSHWAGRPLPARPTAGPGGPSPLALPSCYWKKCVHGLSITMSWLRLADPHEKHRLSASELARR